MLSEADGLDQMSNSGNNGRGDQGSALQSSDVNQMAEDFEDDVVGCTSTFQSYWFVVRNIVCYLDPLFCGDGNYEYVNKGCILLCYFLLCIGFILKFICFMSFDNFVLV